MKKMIWLLFLPCVTYGQADKDSLNWARNKKACDIREFTDDKLGSMFGTNGELIKGFLISTDDLNMHYMLGWSATDTVYTMELIAYGNTWLSNPSGVYGISDYSTVDLPDIPIEVSYDKYKEVYKYKAKIQVHRPFKTKNEQDLASKMFDLMRCSKYKLYIFEQKLKTSDTFQECFAAINYRIFTKERRVEIKKVEEAHDAIFEDLMEEAKKLDAERSKKTKPKTKQNKP